MISRRHFARRVCQCQKWCVLGTAGSSTPSRHVAEVVQCCHGRCRRSRCVGGGCADGAPAWCAEQSRAAPKLHRNPGIGLHDTVRGCRSLGLVAVLTTGAVHRTTVLDRLTVAAATMQRLQHDVGPILQHYAARPATGQGVQVTSSTAVAASVMSRCLCAHLCAATQCRTSCAPSLSLRSTAKTLLQMRSLMQPPGFKKATRSTRLLSFCQI